MFDGFGSPWRGLLAGGTGRADMTGAGGRVFLFLQGPHGPFFRRLAGALAARGAEVRRVAFNRGDEAEWRRAWPLHRFNDDCETFPDWLDALIEGCGVTDIVLYGDTRPVHRMAIARARALGVATHCFEEGYIRPSWVTYERQGNGGNSRLMQIGLPRMAAAVGPGVPPEGAAAVWGDWRQHLWHSVLYHARCLLPTRRYDRFPGHRELPLWRESACYALRALKMPWILLRRAVRQWLLLRSDRRFHLVLLQLSFDSSMRAHSGFRSTSDFVELVIDAFAEGAAPDDWLVFKAHPFEDGRERLGQVIRDLARDLGIGHRVVFIDGGKKLAALLDRARSAITVNSTAAQQALWRGLPVAALGRAVYGKPSLVSDQPLPAFIRQPRRPDLRAYWVFRQFLMRTSQVTGSFYARAGIARLVETLPGIMLDPVDPYDHALEERPNRRAVSAAHEERLLETG